MEETATLYVHGKCHRCRDCPGYAHITNQGYWINKACIRGTKKAAADHMDVWTAGALRHQFHPKAEEFQIASSDEGETDISDVAHTSTSSSSVPSRE